MKGLVEALMEVAAEDGTTSASTGGGEGADSGLSVPTASSDVSERLQPLRLLHVGDTHSLMLNAGCTASDRTIEESGHEPNGYFWHGLTLWLMRCGALEASLAERFDFDPEGDTFVAYGTDRAALETLGLEIARLANDKAAMAELITAADVAGHDFDD